MFTRKRALERIAAEKVLYERHRGGDIPVCVIYPNVYRLAMANLGFQAIYHIFESEPRVAADRAFLPDPDERELMSARGEPLLSFETGSALSDFAILAFSIAFETDYLNLLAIMRMAGIPLRREARAGRNYPLIMAGGSAVFLNPEPIADFIDLFLIGEGEEMVPEFIAAYRDAGGMTGTQRLEHLAQIEGAYLPAYFIPRLDEAGRIATVEYRGPGSSRVKRRLIHDLDRFSTSSLILSEESVFGDMFLVEASRGCQWGCRFCAAGFMYRPIRYRSPERILAEAQRGLGEREVIGLVGAEMASVPGIAEIANAVADRGGRLSPSSLKADCISPGLAEALRRGGGRSVTIAPEAGSERMRKVINKNLSEAEILNAATMLLGSGVEALKLYFMIGLPEETDDDVLEIARLTGKLLDLARARGKSVGRVTVSLNPFVPKPWTPFQWDPMADAAQVKQKIMLLRAALGRISGAIALSAESPREAYFQTMVSRGDRRVGSILERLDAAGCAEPGAIWHELRAIHREATNSGKATRDSSDSLRGSRTCDPERDSQTRSLGAALAAPGVLAAPLSVPPAPDPDFFVTRHYSHDEALPWDFIDHHIHKWFLLSERKKAHFEHQTKPCDVTRCTVCGAC